MKAMAIEQHGGPEQIQAMDLPDPTPGEHDLLIEVHASATNPVDTKIREGGLGREYEFPLVMGYDVSGVVREAGSKVEHLSVGDEVYASPSLARPGANAEFVCVDGRTAARKPQSLSHEQAATLPLVTLTAWEALHQHARLHTSETILIHAGAGGVGHIAIQLAKVHGCRVMATASRDESIALCNELGADVVINYEQEDFVERVKQETDGEGLPVVLDAVSGETFRKSIECVGILGRLVTILPPPDDASLAPLFMKGGSLHLEFMAVPTMYGINLEHQRQILQTVAELVDAGKLKVHVSETFDLEDLAEAHRRQETGHVVGKLAVRVKK